MADSPMKRGLKRGLLLALVLAAALGGFAAWRYFNRGGQMAGMGAEQLQLGGPFTLVDQTGRTVTDKDFAGKLMLVYFGYTFCPDVCPTELANMAAAYDLLTPAERKQVQLVFITVDPERDTTQVLKDYVGNFGNDMVGLGGTAEQVKAAAKAYRVYYARSKETAGSSDYLMDHSGFVYLMGRDGRYRAHFRPQVEPQSIAEKIRSLL
ncbi:MAG: SCO family protein [Ferrovibrionaceae bacterium]|jgi:protein SCO1/2